MATKSQKKEAWMVAVIAFVAYTLILRKYGAIGSIVFFLLLGASVLIGMGKISLMMMFFPVNQIDGTAHDSNFKRITQLLADRKLSNKELTKSIE